MSAFVRQASDGRTTIEHLLCFAIELDGHPSTYIPSKMTVLAADAQTDTTKDDSQQEGKGREEILLARTGRKKLKKLRKRAAKVLTEYEQSGLLTKSEWHELEGLAKEDGTVAVNAVPSIARRKNKEGNKVEGDHHRDLLGWIMKQILDLHESSGSGKSSKKRQRNEDDNSDLFSSLSIPSWASIHNPGTIESLAVVELHVPMGSLQQYTELVSRTPTTRVAAPTIPTKTHKPKILELQTKLFQGYVPKSISDCLFYSTADMMKSKRPRIGENIPTHDELLKILDGLVLPQQSLELEGYPTVLKKEAASELIKSQCTEQEAVNLMNDPSLVKLEDAKDWVSNVGVRVKNQDAEDNILYVPSLQSAPSSLPTAPRIFGMDCEMVRTDKGSELARISLIQFESFESDTVSTKTVMDALVKPYNPVKDYLTRHSGITPELLRPIATRLEQVQWALVRFLRPTDILVGHSLENDLVATRLLHPRVIDTAILFRHRSGRTKFSLRHLSNVLLRKTIQQGSHCSEEDALATLELAIRRACLGSTFGIAGGNQDKRSILELLQKKTPPPRAVCIGPPNWLSKYATSSSNGVHALSYESIKDCQKALTAWMKGTRKTQLIWCSVNAGSNEEAIGEVETMLVSRPIIVVIVQCLSCDASLMGYLLAKSDVLDTKPATAVTLIVLQEGFSRAQADFQKRRACKDTRSTVGWTDKEEMAWKKSLEACRSGAAFWVTADKVLAAETK